MTRRTLRLLGRSDLALMLVAVFCGKTVAGLTRHRGMNVSSAGSLGLASVFLFYLALHYCKGQIPQSWSARLMKTARPLLAVGRRAWIFVCNFVCFRRLP